MFEIILGLNTKNISLVSPIFQNYTKPVKMMQQKSKFPFATIPEANCEVTSITFSLLQDFTNMIQNFCDCFSFTNISLYF